MPIYFHTINFFTALTFSLEKSALTLDLVVEFRQIDYKPGTILYSNFLIQQLNINQSHAFLASDFVLICRVSKTDEHSCSTRHLLQVHH